MSSLFLILFLLNLKNSCVSSTNGNDLRLPEGIEPVEYNLTVKVYLPGYGYVGNIDDGNEKNMTFDGEVLIAIQSSISTKNLSLNSIGLNFTQSECKLKDEKNNSIVISSIETNDKLEKVFFELENEIEANSSVILKIVYRGKLRTDMKGLYQTVYTNGKGDRKMAAATHFEPIAARYMVPCFDEPSFKAAWKVTVIHPKGTVAIANGIENGKPKHMNEEFIISKFKTTPRMSTYLLAILVSEFEYNELKTKSGVRFRVWSRPEEKNSTKFAVQAGVKCLEFYEEYFGIKFPLEKQDMVALPDFSAGAMENWGLVIYRENSLLYNPKIYAGSQKRRIASIIAHELAHQWFGNLVTMKWWNDLWLNEGFARFMEYKGANHISDGKLKMDEWKLFATWHMATKADSVATSHPLTVKIDKASEIRDFFDKVTYEKGASVISMISKVLGEENFHSGIKNYLRKHTYKNAEAQDLFDALEENLPDNVLGSEGKKLNVTDFAGPWTKQLGYPLLTVSKINSTFVKVSQQRFKLLPDAEEQEKYSNPKWKFNWDVPIWYQIGNTQKMVWLEQNATVNLETNAETPVLNSDSLGFYRVNYDEELWDDITQQFEKPNLYSTSTRVRLIEDAFASASAGLLNYSIPIKLAGCLKYENEYLPWKIAITEIEDIIDRYGKDERKQKIKQYLREAIAKSPAKQSIKYVSDSYLEDDKLFEVFVGQLLIKTECSLGVDECIRNMTKLFEMQVLSNCTDKQLTSDCSSVAAPFRSLVYSNAVQNGTLDTFNKILNWYKIERNSVEKANLQKALTRSKNFTLLEELMLEGLKKKGSTFRLQDVHQLFANVAENDVAKDHLLDFMIERWDTISGRLSADRSVFNKVIIALTSGIRTQSDLERMNKFVSKTKSAQEYNFHKIEESVDLIVKWRQRYLDQIASLF